MAQHKTLLFCTAHAKDSLQWSARYQKWLNYYSQSPLEHSQILLIDDGSTQFPSLNNVNLYHRLPPNQPSAKRVLFHFDTHLGRIGLKDFPGWFRSFGFAAEYAQKYKFTKIVHLESDFYILSPALFEYINQISDGWTSLFSKKYSMPETACQIICEDQFSTYLAFVNKDYKTSYVGFDLENLIPFTNANKAFVGDRVDDQEAINPSCLDYVAQAPNGFKPETNERKADSTSSAEPTQMNTLLMTPKDIQAAVKLFLNSPPIQIPPDYKLMNASADDLLFQFINSKEFLSRPGAEDLLINLSKRIKQLGF